MELPGFIGPAYISTSRNVACEELVNWYLEPTQAPESKRAAFYPTPGLDEFATGLNAPIRGEFAQDGRAFVVAGGTLYEIDGVGAATVLGSVANDDQPASMASNGHGGHQLMVVSGGSGYIFDLNTSVFQAITSASFPTNAIMVDYLDGYFVVLQATTSIFYISALFDGLTWLGDFGQVSASSDTTTAMRVINRNVWFFGTERSQPWITTGNTFALQPIANVLVEFGIGAPWSLDEADGSLFFVGKDGRGSALVLRSSGYDFQKISTHYIDQVLSALPDLSNVRGYTYQERGHTFYVLCPNTGPALAYDLSTGLWALRGTWNDGLDRYDPLLQWCHMYAFGKHLVGDRTTGTIYEQSLSYGTDAGTPIRRVRTGAHTTADFQWMFGSEVILGVETGGATVSDPTPTVNWSYSKDGGHTFSTPSPTVIGAQGQYSELVRWYQTPGRFHDLVPRITTNATIPVNLWSIDLRIAAGTGQR